MQTGTVPRSLSEHQVTRVPIHAVKTLTDSSLVRGEAKATEGINPLLAKD